MTPRGMTGIAIGLIIGAIIALSLWLLPVPEQSTIAPAHYDVTRIVRYRIVIENPRNTAEKNVTATVLAPVAFTGYQKLVDVKASHPFEQQTDDWGNTQLHFAFDVVPPYGKRELVITAQVQLAKTPNPSSDSIKPYQAMLARNPDYNHPSIQHAATNIQSADAEGYAQRITDYVNKRIRYLGYVKEDRGAVYALNERQGDCTEYMSLFNALAHQKGLVVRGIGGFIMSQNGVLDPSDYHNWSEYYHQQRWYHADPQNNVVRDQNARYIAFRLLNDAQPAKNSHQLAWVSNDLLITMQ